MSAEGQEFGEWWLPGADRERVPGPLIFNELDGARVTLLGFLSGLHLASPSPPALHGRLLDGTHVTLISPTVLRQQFFRSEDGATARTELRSQVLLRGDHVSSQEDLLIDKAEVQVSGLRDICFQPPPVDPSTPQFLAIGDPGPQQRLVEVDGGWLHFAHGRATHEESRFRRAIDDDVVVTIKIQEPKALDEFEDEWLLPLLGLVIFASRGPSVVEGFEVARPIPRDDLRESWPKPASWTIEWYEPRAQLLMPPPGLTAIATPWRSPLVPLWSLGDEASDFIKQWWRLYKKLGSGTDVLLNAWGSRMFLENRLLNDLSFAESYHRVMHDEPVVPEETHEENVERMVATIEDPLHRDHYRLRLRYAGEQSQRQRLKWLVTRARATLPMLPGMNMTLVGKLIDTRNALTHLDDTGPPALKHGPLYRVIELLEVAIQVNLLRELVSEDKARSLILASYNNETPFIPVPD